MSNKHGVQEKKTCLIDSALSKDEITTRYHHCS